VWVAGQEITLTPLEYKLLVTLHDRREHVQSRDTLLSDVWGISADVTTRTVDTHVKRLRSKLGEAADYVQTIRGIGYRFAGSPDERA
jgi:two-component system phosphate regulon response regulator PhoB